MHSHFQRARKRHLKNRSTDAEALLWYFLQNRAFHKQQFFRKYMLGSYAVDFVCLNKKLIIELDKLGDHQIEGYRVLRFTHSEVFGNLQSVLDQIEKAMKKI